MNPGRRGLSCLAALAVSCAAHRPANPSSRIEGRPLDFVAHDSGGETVDLGARQGRVLLLAFFATWAQGSRTLLPQLQAVAQTFKDEPLEVFGVALDVDGRFVGPFAEKLGLGFPILRDPGAQESESRLGLSVAPTVLVVDREGVVRAVHRGVQEDTARDVAAELRVLLERPVRSGNRPVQALDASRTGRSDRRHARCGREAVQAFYGALAGQRATKGVFLTTSSFTPQATEYGRSVEKVVLVDGARLAGPLMEYGAGVSHRVIKIPKIDSDCFEE